MSTLLSHGTYFQWGDKLTSKTGDASDSINADGTKDKGAGSKFEQLADMMALYRTGCWGLHVLGMWWGLDF